MIERQKLPEPDFWVAEDSLRHAMHPAYRHQHQAAKYGREGVWIGVWTRESIDAWLKANDRKDER